MRPSFLYQGFRAKGGQNEAHPGQMQGGWFDKADEDSLSVCWETLLWGEKRNSVRRFSGFWSWGERSPSNTHFDLTLSGTLGLSSLRSCHSPHPPHTRSLRWTSSPLPPRFSPGLCECCTESRTLRERQNVEENKRVENVASSRLAHGRLDNHPKIVDVV